MFKVDFVVFMNRVLGQHFNQVSFLLLCVLCYTYTYTYRPFMLNPCFSMQSNEKLQCMIYFIFQWVRLVKKIHIIMFSHVSYNLHHHQCHHHHHCCCCCCWSCPECWCCWRPHPRVTKFTLDYNLKVILIRNRSFLSNMIDDCCHVVHIFLIFPFTLKLCKDCGDVVNFKESSPSSQSNTFSCSTIVTSPISSSSILFTFFGSPKEHFTVQEFSVQLEVKQSLLQPLETLLTNTQTLLKTFHKCQYHKNLSQQGKSF